MDPDSPAPVPAPHTGSPILSDIDNHLWKSSNLPISNIDGRLLYSHLLTSAQQVDLAVQVRILVNWLHLFNRLNSDMYHVGACSDDAVRTSDGGPTTWKPTMTGPMEERVLIGLRQIHLAALRLRRELEVRVGVPIVKSKAETSIIRQAMGEELTRMRQAMGVHWKPVLGRLTSEVMQWIRDLKRNRRSAML